MSDKGLIILKKHEQEYWRTIEDGIQFVPIGYLPDFLTLVQQVVIYDCTDGYLILRFAKREEVEFIVTRNRSISWQDLLSKQKMYDQNGRETTRRLTLHIRDPSKFQGEMVSLGSIEVRSGASIFRPKWISATVVEGEPKGNYPNPVQEAKRDIQTIVAANNLSVQIDANFNITSDKVIRRLENLLAQYKQILTEARVEEDIQKFITKNPFILKPWGTVHPKYRLGTEYICDFLVEDLFAVDFKYTFVEIEPASTDLFRKNNREMREFRSRVNHGLSQLRDWEIWIRENVEILKADFPQFDQACFILVIGRSKDLSVEQKKIIVNENARSKSFTILTYDDLEQRLEELINKLRKLPA